MPRIEIINTTRLNLIALIFIGFITTGCAGMSHRQQNAAVGAAVGGVAGAILTGGSSFGTVGGAAIGGIIGHGVDGISTQKKHTASSSSDKKVAKKATNYGI